MIFPGVGEANSAMSYLKERQLDTLIKELTQPVLGICLGIQLMCNYSEENDTECLGIFDTPVKRFPPKDKVPHIGWNEVTNDNAQLLHGFQQPEDVYFVHSYYAEICQETVGRCNYILPFSAVMEKDNFFATQFHPEKSGAVGERILRNFLVIICKVLLTDSFQNLDYARAIRIVISPKSILWSGLFF